MGKLDVVAAEELKLRLRAQWKLTEGDVYDQTYIDHYLEANRDLLPANFSRANVPQHRIAPKPSSKSVYSSIPLRKRRTHNLRTFLARNSTMPRNERH